MFSSYHNPPGPRNCRNGAPMFNLKGGDFTKYIIITVSMKIISLITLALDKDGTLL